MRVVVCIKQVPETTEVRLDPATGTLRREGVAAVMNPFDLFALEAALRVREAVGGQVVAITMGPPQAAEVIKEAIGYGVDEGMLISDPAFAGSDTLATTKVLAAAIRHLGGADLVVCGKQAIDGDTAQVGPGLAARLGIGHVAFVKAIRQVEPGRIVVERQSDTGYEVLEMALPGLITVLREIGTPRPPSLKGKMRAKRYQVPTLGAGELGLGPEEVGLKGSPTQVVRIFSPPAVGERRMIEGPEEEAGRQVVDILVEGKVITLGG